MKCLHKPSELKPSEWNMLWARNRYALKRCAILQSALLTNEFEILRDALLTNAFEILNLPFSVKAGTKASRQLTKFEDQLGIDSNKLTYKWVNEEICVA